MKEVIVNSPADVHRAMQRITHVLSATYDPSNARKVLTVTGINIVNRVVKSMRHSGTGRVYTRRGVAHRASSPGDPAASDLGRLMDSWTWQLGQDRDGVYIDVGTNVDYAVPLEFGTSEMEPRPTLRPAAEAESVLIADRHRAFYAEKLARAVHDQGGA